MSLWAAAREPVRGEACRPGSSRCNDQAGTQAELAHPKPLGRASFGTRVGCWHHLGWPGCFRLQGFWSEPGQDEVISGLREVSCVLGGAVCGLREVWSPADVGGQWGSPNVDAVSSHSTHAG